MGPPLAPVPPSTGVPAPVPVTFRDGSPSRKARALDVPASLWGPALWGQEQRGSCGRTPGAVVTDMRHVRHVCVCTGLWRTRRVPALLWGPGLVWEGSVKGPPWLGACVPGEQSRCQEVTSTSLENRRRRTFCQPVRSFPTITRCHRTKPQFAQVLIQNQNIQIEWPGRKGTGGVALGPNKPGGSNASVPRAVEVAARTD